MSKVQLKVTVSLGGILNVQSSDWLTLEKDIGEGATMRDLFAELAFSYADFRKAVFDPDIGEVSDRVMVVLNHNLVQLPDVTKAKLNDGDRIILLPVYTGG